MIPKYKNSDLSPDFLDYLEMTFGFNYLCDYIDENSEQLEGRCKWLKDNDDGTTICIAYNRRNIECRDYPGLSECLASKTDLRS